MHDDNDFTNPPGRRIGALALIRNSAGDVLLVEKKYKEGPERWGLVGGCAGRNEDALDAVRRETREEIGRDITPGALLTVHRMPTNGDSEEGYNLVFDGGVIERDIGMRLAQELRSYQFVAPDALSNYAAPYTVQRIRAALTALDGQPAAYLAGHPA